MGLYKEMFDQINTGGHLRKAVASMVASMEDSDLELGATLTCSQGMLIDLTTHAVEKTFIAMDAHQAEALRLMDIPAGATVVVEVLHARIIEQLLDIMGEVLGNK